MRIDIITIFPGMIESVLSFGVIRRAREKSLLDVHVHDLRDYSTDKHRTVDDYIYGGGPGMLLKPEPIFNAVEALRTPDCRVILMTPQGGRFSQRDAERLSLQEHLIFICGRYKGVDERVRKILVDEEISIGDYVLSGGELPALVVIEALVRLIPGAISDYDSAQGDSFGSDMLLDCPHYTRPPSFRGMRVPEILLAGDHRKIAVWRRRYSLKRTLERRPDLLEDALLTDEDLKVLEELNREKELMKDETDRGFREQVQKDRSARFRPG
jgi:tRNA (guanine37-N1)-methyltransferase